MIEERDKVLLDFISPKRKNKILIIGTGVFPRIEENLLRYGCRSIVSGDIDLKNIENGKKALPKVRFIYLDAQKIFPFKDEEFDKVIFTEVLEHLKKENIALREIYRVLKKSGIIIISVPKRRWFNVFSPITWIQHKREYNERRIIQVLEKNGFHIEKIIAGGDVKDLINLWIHLIYKHVFGILHIGQFFKNEYSWKKGFKGKGTDIIIKAKK